jgi:SAM-dependent methyltransferase
MAKGWQAFWERPNRIYAGEAHLRAHYKRIFRDLSPHLPADPAAVVLDYGCGDALAAEALAGRAGRLWLYDASPRVRDGLQARLAGHPRIGICDDPHLTGLATASVDLALLISVVQYVDVGTLRAMLATIRRVLKTDGRLIVADVIAPGTPLVRDVASRLKFAAANGFLLADLAALVRLQLSDYRHLRGTIGLTTYDEASFLAVLRDSGFASERLDHNVGPSSHRLAFVGRPL